MGKLIKVSILLLLLSDLFCEWACAAKEGYSDFQLQETVRMRCTKCHPAYYYEEKRHTGFVWELVILRMQLINGAKLKRGERGIISAFMAKVRPALFALISPILLILALVRRYLKRAKALNSTLSDSKPTPLSPPLSGGIFKGSPLIRGAGRG